MACAQAQQQIHLPVRELAEFVCRAGSIDTRTAGGGSLAERGLLGARLHRRLQREGGAGYTPEVSVTLSCRLEEFAYTLSGRADGVIETPEGLVVDEIKTTARKLELLAEDEQPAHWAQGCCYAHILCVQRKLPGARVQLSYCNIETGHVRRFLRTYSADDLQAFFTGLLQSYQRWARLTAAHAAARDEGLRELAFPFKTYREGQRAMAIACYNTCKAGGRLLACAPTGIGKTISALFPAMKAMGEGQGGPIFYLTAKTITRKAAENTVAALCREGSLRFRSLTLTAKDKACPLEKRACNPVDCPYADGYFSRVNDAVYEILEKGLTLSREGLAEAAEHYRLCPYELSLDLARWCDCVICDYNYLFDPTVRLQRFFDIPGGDYLFLVDEAHNLAERGREMYSARLRKEDFYGFKRTLPKTHVALHRALAAVNSAFVALRKKCQEENTPVWQQAHLPSELERPIARFTEAAERFLEDERSVAGEAGAASRDALLELYFEALFYQQMAEGYDAHYTTLVYAGASDVTVKLFCMDASQFLDKAMELGRAAVLFSATLRPLPYYRSTLGCAGAKLMDLESPFPRENLGLFVAGGVSTKYAQRAGSIGAVSRLLYQLATARTGNYIAYFPSYSYMRQVHEAFAALHPDIPTLPQQSGMDETEREQYLAAFKAGGGQSLLGFCVLGGIFAEGVDLAGDRLLGAAIVGVGLPQLGPEPDTLRRYYDEAAGCGFEFAYQYPGMNKVLQAAGRVIRTEADRGVVLLIDSRFPSPRYQSLFPAHWAHWKATSQSELGGQLEAFWAGE